MADIDIDLPTTFDPQKYFEVVPASMVQDGFLIKHPCGVYFQKIAQDKLTDLAAVPYEQAEELGFFKVDFLHLSVLDYFSNKEEITQLLKVDPDWSLLLDRTVVSKLFQIHKHADLLQQIQPTSVQELADCIALIRPGKRQLLNQYLNDKEGIRKELYKKTDKYYFKRSHAIAYALTIVLQLHLIKGQIL